MKKFNLLNKILLATVFALTANLAKADTNFSQATCYPNYYQPIQYQNLDTSYLKLLKEELVNTKNALIDIKNSQNPGIIKGTFGSLKKVLKECTYIGSSILLGAGLTYAIFMTKLGQKLANGAQIPDNFSLGAALGTLSIIAPFAIVDMIIIYILLKKFIGSSKGDPLKINIQENLFEIDKIIAKINYAIDRIEAYENSQKLNIAVAPK